MGSDDGNVCAGSTNKNSTLASASASSAKNGVCMTRPDEQCSQPCGQFGSDACNSGCPDPSGNDGCCWSDDGNVCAGSTKKNNTLASASASSAKNGVCMTRPGEQCSQPCGQWSGAGRDACNSNCPDPSGNDGC